MSELDHENLEKGARKRTCTNEGTGFFLTTVAKNCKKLKKTINQQILKIDELLSRGNLEDAKKLMDALSEVHKEFIRSHLRYQSLSEEVDHAEEKRIAEGILQQVTEVFDRVAAAAGAGNKSEANRANIRHEIRLQINDKINKIHE